MTQTKVGWRPYVATTTTTASTLLTSIYGVWNADTLGTSLDSSIFRVYNGDNVNDTSGNAQNGTNVNNVTFTTGKVGNAFTFNGSNYVTLPNNSMKLTGDFSISCWVNIAAHGTYQTILSGYYTTAGVDYGFVLRVENNGGFKFRLFSGAAQIDTNPGGGAISTNTWYHVTVTKTSSQVKWYINGVADNVFNGTYNIPYHPTIAKGSIGALYQWNGTDTTHFMSNNSKIDALSVWNKELTAGEITSLYNAGTGAEYPFSSQLLPSPNDSVSANHGTLINGATFTDGKIGKAFTFDGVNDYVALPNNIMKFSNTDNWSVSFWIYQTAGASSGVIGNWDYSGGQGTGWGIRTGGTVGGDPSKFTIQLFTNWINGSGNLLNPLSTLGTTSINTWNHFVITRNSSAQEKIYQNGTLVASQTNSSTKLTYPATSYSCIGAERYQSNIVGYAKAGSKIDALSVWNKELTSTEITELYNSGTGKQYPNY